MSQAQPSATEGGSAASAMLEIPPLARARRLSWLVVVVLLGAGGALGYLRWQARPVPETLRLAAVEKRSIVHRIEAVGRLDVPSRIEVSSPVAGRLVEIAATPGERVEAGSVLARLDAGSTTLALAGAHAALQATAAQTARARVVLSALEQERKHLEELARRGLASSQQVAKARAEEVEAQAALRAARAEQAVVANQVSTVELQKKLHEIVAPVSGVVLAAPDRLGAAVAPESGPLFEITDTLDELTVHASLSEREVGQVSVGRAAFFTVQAFDERRFEAVVERVDLEPQRSSGAVLYPFRLRAKNPDGALRPGMTVLVEIEIERVDDALAVPEAALRFAPAGAEPTAPRSRLFRRVDPTHLEEVSVVPGLSDGAFTAVRVSGNARLQAGDRVAVGLLVPEAGSGGPAAGVSLGEKR